MKIENINAVITGGGSGLGEGTARLLKEKGAETVDIKQDAENAYAEHCREADINTQPLRDCISYYNGHGDGEPGSLAYYGGAKKWHEKRQEAQESMEAYVFGDST